MRRIIFGLLLAYQALFLNVVLPGHTRGMITMDGRHTGGCPACCTADGETTEQHDHSKQAPSKQAPSQRDRDNCALCNFAARITTPPVFRFAITEPTLLALLPLPPLATAVSLDCTPTYLGRGPPPVAL